MHVDINVRLVLISIAPVIIFSNLNELLKDQNNDFILVALSDSDICIILVSL